MELNEFFQTLPKLQQDAMHPEFDVYVRTWVRNRYPQIHADLIASFRKDEGQIYAHQQLPIQQEMF